MRNFIVAILMLFWSTVAMACPTCGGVKEVLPTQQSASIADRFTPSIFVLLSTVVLAMGFLGWTMYKSIGPTKRPETDLTN